MNETKLLPPPTEGLAQSSAAETGRHDVVSTVTASARKPVRRGGAPLGNLNGVLHGARLKKLLNAGELKSYHGLIRQMYDDFGLNESSDAILVAMVAFNTIRWGRSLETDDPELARLYQREVVALLTALKATPEQRNAVTVEVKTPAEWAADLLARVRVGPGAATSRVVE